jgi:hypothetical protein
MTCSLIVFSDHTHSVRQWRSSAGLLHEIQISSTGPVVTTTFTATSDDEHTKNSRTKAESVAVVAIHLFL